MLDKFIKSFMILSMLTPFTYEESDEVLPESISILGSLQMPELYEDIPISLQMTQGHPFAVVVVEIYVNGNLLISEQTISSHLADKPFVIGGFNEENSRKIIKVSVKYLEGNAPATQCQFTLVAPHYYTYKSNATDSFSLKENNPISINFSMKGVSYTITKYYEKVILNGKYDYQITNTRILDLSPFSITFYNITPNFDSCELRLYCQFEGSDLLYKDGYTSIDIGFSKYSDYRFNLKNEYKYYIDKNTGMIFENQTENCEDELLPFFFPLSMGIEKSIPYELHFYDIGKNHNNYIFSGNINLTSNNINIENPSYGSVLNFKYVELETLDIDYA